MQAPPGLPSSPGALDLYGDLVEAARSTLDAARRRRLAIVVELSMIAIYVLLRTADVGRGPLALWTAAAIAISVLSPVSGLVILAAIAPFSEPFTVTRQLSVKTFLVVALAAGVVIRVAWWAAAWVLARRTRMSGAIGRSAVRYTRQQLLVAASLASAVVLLVGTGLGVVHTIISFDHDFAAVAAQSWLAGIGGGLIILLVAAWAGYSGTIRPLVAAVVSATVGGIVSLADFLDAGSIRGAVVDWLLRQNRGVGRLTGIIPSANAVEALLIAPTVILVAVAVLGRDVRLRVVALAAALPLSVALYFTYSRAALIGLFLTAVIVTWRIRRRVGMVVLVVGVAGGLLLLPSYLRARGEQLGQQQAAPQPGEQFIATDAWRLRAWGAAGQMWLAAPLVGHGFMSYQALHEAYGDPMLRSPHNEWLRFFAEEGAFVGLAGLAFVGFTAAALTYGRGAIGAGIFAGFLAFAAATVFNNPFLFVQVLAIAFAITGIGLGRIPAGREHTAAAVNQSRDSRVAATQVRTMS
ncbi:MAG: O-antigen ligase family protein [Chloroflexota bacterium]|nr:O-antigen ligase family protein [Chloroflexota bacterium]